MPSVEVKTNVKVPDKITFLQALTDKGAEILNKPKEYMQIILEDEVAMTFAGTSDPTFCVNIFSRNSFSNLSKNTEMSQEFSKFIEEKLCIPPNRGYFFLKDPGEHRCGWNNKTFP
ncbi:Tautomerase/MIF superfamily [Gigaspora rosea]|uniref:L-dopachrome isomerase n=1 Tax=Gigaspora rosea TaxID=44941 RepID=A0A397UAQ2_9GLOM|nr:Tautomerase/MIF superfamily [Gigaspora rosea]